MARRRNQTGRRDRRRSSRRANINDVIVPAEEQAAEPSEPEGPLGPVELPPFITVGGLSEILHKDPVDTIKALMRCGVMATINEQVDFETAARAAGLFDIPVLKPKDRKESKAGVKVGVDDTLTEENSVERPPVVTVLGHVDHGKTTLLDAIRGANVVEEEAGGITQGIGAYGVIKDGREITFIDTPGHKAFTAMRASGTQVTDVAILVVAADDGVMPQTIEAIDHAKAADVPIIVAINKVDVAGADPNRVKTQLTEHDLVVEEFGGDVVAVEVSALNKDGVDDLLEAVLLVAEVLELKGNPNRPGIGVVIESNVDRARGAMATVIVRSGTVRLGANVVVGTKRGRVRAMTGGAGVPVEEAGPATPVEILGLDGAPTVGDPFDVVKDDRTARQLVQTRQRIATRHSRIKSAATASEAIQLARSEDVRELPIVVKTGTQGSVDAVRRSVEDIAEEGVQLSVLHAAAGAVNDSDVMLAAVSGGIIVGFQTETEAGAGRQAAIRGVQILHYEIIYQLIDDVVGKAQQLVAPSEHEVIVGHALVQEVFSAGRRDRAAGIRVSDGHLLRNANIRVLRSGEEIFSGRIASMRHFKENQTELATGFEGGVVLQGFNSFEVGDVLEGFEVRATEK